MRDRIVHVLNEIRPEFDFAAETDFISNGMLDSFDLISLVSSLDEEFNVSIDGVDVIPENFENIESIENLLRKKGVA